MNVSKVKELRFWKKWVESGATIPGVRLSLEKGMSRKLF
jgi:hypothetical protein